MSSLYIGVYKSLYDYAAQAEEELSLNVDDLLYLLERSDVDDWWKVKKRVVPVGDEEVEEPMGLVPSNYIEPAPIVKSATALYDYDKQTEEEVSFKEGDRFNIYDLSDPDWLLVSDVSNSAFGFIPSNYIELDSSTSAPPAPQFAPPPQHPSAVLPPPQHPSMHTEQEEAVDERTVEPEEDIESPPRMPARPTLTADLDELPPPKPSRPLQATTTGSGIGDYEEEEQVSPQQEHSFDGDFFTWFIDEVDGRKKRAVKFSIGKGMVIMKPNTSNPKKLKMKSASQLDNEWKIRDLLDFSHEKKHVFLEFKNPQASIELHAGSKDVSEAIVSILGDLKGAENARGMQEVAKASHSTTDSSNRKIGKLMFDFASQGKDELECREGDEVYIINDTKSKDWWMCENIDTKKQGVVPSSYIEIVGTSNLDKLTDGPQRRKSQKSKGRVVESSKRNHRRSRDEREKIRERDRSQRDKTSQKSDKNDKSMPNYHRVRTWIDSSGSFKVEAEFLGCVEGKIHLHKTNGVKIAVSANKLSVEDLEYVEKITGTSLSKYKEEVAKQLSKKQKATETSSGKSSVAAINDIPPPKPSRPKTTTAITTGEPEYDWFEFFLQCGVDIGYCQRYTLNFNREQMDENILEEITPSLLRTLGLREGDILRVMKFLDNKFNRKKQVEEPAPTGGLFTESTGALKNNSSNTDVSKVSANALPAPSPSNGPKPADKFEDDAWAVKPAARSNEDLSVTSSRAQTPQYTGSLQDLVNIKPLELNVDKPMPALPKDQTPLPPALTPVKTGNLVKPGEQYSVTTPGTNPLSSNLTGFKPVPAQQTGNLIPAQPTGFIPIQPTGFIPIQPTGFVPIQQTGMQPQLTFGVVPLQTGATTFQAQQTGPQVPQTSFGQMPVQPVLQTGGVTMPQTTFGQPAQYTGGVPPQITGGQLSLQRTGPLVPTQRTGGFVPQSSFGQQITGGFGAMPNTSFGSQATGPQPSFGQGPQTTFGSQVTGQPSFGQNFQTGNQMFPQTSFGQGTAPFGQQPVGFQNTFNQNNLPQTSFGQPDMNQLNNMFQNTGISNPSFGQNIGQNVGQNNFQPNTSFNQFNGFGNQPLQSQPTGSGFGNAPQPLQSQATGRANIHAATPDNPFGF